MQQLFVGGGSNQGMVYQSGGGGQRGGGRGGRSGQGGRNRTLFANHMVAAGRGRAKAGPGQDIPQMGGGFTQMATPGAFSPAQQSAQHANPPHETQQLECMLLMRIQCGIWAHVANVPGTLTQGKSPR